MSSSSCGGYEKYVTLAATAAGTAMVLRGFVRDLLPDELRGLLFSWAWPRSFLSRLSPRRTVVIDDAEGLSSNQLYDAARAYLAARVGIADGVRRLRASLVDRDCGDDAQQQGITVTMDKGEEMVDVHDGVEYTWRLVCHDAFSAAASDARGRGGRLDAARSFEVSFHKKHKEQALTSYLPFVLAMAKAIKDQRRCLKMHMIEYEAWTAVDLRHPSTFDTLAMDRKLKLSVMEDLERFVKRKDYYRKIGRAWKRGYLLHGPPGTGKSSLIAAMANYLKFDIYDLELTEVKCNSDLRRLLVGMSSRSILVVEDIDCSIEIQHRDEAVSGAKLTTGEENEDKVTLSGLLNFVDGLWSTSGEERIIVFTTNYKERLDPALLRPGRMDMHVHMGYCTPESFRILATNYHSAAVVQDHAMCPKIERLVEEVPVTPAEVAEVLMRNDEADAALRDLVAFLEAKMGGTGEITVAKHDGNGGKVNKYEQAMASNQVSNRTTQMSEQRED